MFDPSTEIRTEYFTRLDGALTIGATNVPIYDRVKHNAHFPYVRFDQLIINEHFPQCRNSKAVRCSVFLKIYTGFETAKELGGKRYPDVVAEQILALMSTPMVLPSYQEIGDPVLESNSYDELTEQQEEVVGKILQIQHIITT